MNEKGKAFYFSTEKSVFIVDFTVVNMGQTSA